LHKKTFIPVSCHETGQHHKSSRLASNRKFTCPRQHV